MFLIPHPKLAVTHEQVSKMDGTTKASLCFLLLFGLISGSVAEKSDRLENLIANLTGKFGDFVAAVEKLSIMLARMEEKADLQDLIGKCVDNINSRNHVGVIKLWKQIVKNHNKTHNILNEIIVDAYSGKRENILPLIRFIVETARCSGFETLFREMNDYGHFYDGVEIFSLANAILNHCNYAMFQKLPNTVQWILTKNVTLQNTFSKGYLYRKYNTRDNGLDNQIATIRNVNNTDYFRFVPANENGDSFFIRHRNANLVASPSRRLYFANVARSRFTVEMKKNEEIIIGVDLETAGGRRFYRIYVQKTKAKSADNFDINLWTINPGDEYGKYIYWVVKEHE